MGLDDRNHFGKVKFHIGAPDAIGDIQDRKRPGRPRKDRGDQEVMKARIVRRSGVDLQNDFFGFVQRFCGNAHRRSEHRCAVFQNPADLYDGKINLPLKVVHDVSRECRKMHIAEVHLPGMNQLAGSRRGHIGTALSDERSQGALHVLRERGAA